MSFAGIYKFVNIKSIIVSCNLQFKRFQHETKIMSKYKRYFVNKLPDFDQRDAEISTDEWKRKILETVNVIKTRQSPSPKFGDGGLYVGVAGIGYMFYHLSTSPVFAEDQKDLLNHAVAYIDAAVEYSDKHEQKSSQKAAFLLGSAGAYAVAAVLYHTIGNTSKSASFLKKFDDASACCKPVNFLKCGGDELLVGRAGYLSGVLWLQKALGKSALPESDVFEICLSIIKSGREYSQRHHSPCPLMFAYYNVEYLGAAHGLSTILQMLMSFPKFLKSDHQIESDVKHSVDYLLGLQTTGGNFPCAMDEISGRRSEQDELVHWCHGAPGVVYLMAKAYLLWHEDKYLQSCIRCGELVWQKGLLRKGPGICHGVAGSGYVFLLLYRLTNDKKYLYRAQAFAKFMYTSEFIEEARTPDSPYSLYEGLAGTVCFLSDLLNPPQAAFPFLDVF